MGMNGDREGGTLEDLKETVIAKEASAEFIYGGIFQMKHATKNDDGRRIISKEIKTGKLFIEKIKTIYDKCANGYSCHFEYYDREEFTN